MNEWRQVLRKCTGEEIKHGFEVWDSEHPPNVYQFKHACLSLRHSGSHKQFKALPKPEPDKELGQKFLNHAHTVLKNTKQYSAKDTGGTSGGDGPGILRDVETSGRDIGGAVELDQGKLQRGATQQAEGSDGKTTTDRDSGDQE